jgi:hypothetical protein
VKFLNDAIYSRLNGATALTNILAGGTIGTSIFALQAPKAAAYPYIVYSVQGGGDTNDTQNRVKDIVLFVRAYGTVNRQAGSIDAQIDTALHLVPFSNVTGWTNIWLAREQDLEMVENPPTSEQVFMNGGLYRVMLDKN